MERQQLAGSGRMVTDPIRQLTTEVASHDGPLPGNAMSILANLLVYPVGDSIRLLPYLATWELHF